MSIYDSRLWLADLDETIAALPELKELNGAAVMITGCSGLVCSPVADVFIRWNMKHGGQIRLLAAERSEEKIRRRFGPYADKEWFRFIPFNAVSTAGPIGPPCDYIIHGAGNSSPDRIVKEPVETMLGSLWGTKRLLDHAKAHNTKRVLLISSSEVYGNKAGAPLLRGADSGAIDLLNPRSAYPVGKCAAETLCASYAAEYGVSSVIVRPGHIYGPTAALEDRHVSSAWAYAAAGGNGIVLKSDGAQVRSYCYCLDCASAIVKVLLKGEDVHAYNISNPDSILSIGEMAGLLAKAGGVALRREPPTDREKMAFNPMKTSALDSTELLKLGWQGRFDAERGFSHTVRILKTIMNHSGGERRGPSARPGCRTADEEGCAANGP